MVHDVEMITTEETARVLRCSVRIVRNMIASGKLRGCIKVGNGYRVPSRAIEEATGGLVRITRASSRAS